MNARDWNGRESRDWNGKSSGPGWADAADEKAIGTIDDYELLRELGTGGFGSVYLARDKVSRTFVAVKGLPQQVSDSAGELERVRANYALVSKLKHPNVAAVLALRRVDVISCGDSEVLRKLNVKSGDTLLVMDYAPGVTLDSWCRQFTDRKVPVDRAIEVTRQIAAALDAAHKLKIVHRDIKPQNVMVETLSDGTFTARVLDFGLAAEVRSSVNRVSGDGAKDDKGKGDTSGTLRYMAPEQLEGRRPRVAMDQYALAALFYEMVTGDVPFSSVFECRDKGIIVNVVTTKPPEIPAELLRPVRKALARALAKKPEDRFATCGEFVAALQGVVPIRWGLVAGILAAVAVAGAGAWWMGRGGTIGIVGPQVSQTVTVAPTAEQLRAQELAAENAVYDLMRDMESAKKKIAAESDEVRSFFATEIRVFEKKFASAKEAKNDSRLVIATNFLVQAKAQADALRKLVDARKDSLVARQRALDAQKTADTVEAKTALASRYGEAEKIFAGGDSHARQRDFVAAKSAYETAAQTFTALRADVIKVTLDQTKRHQADERWQECLASAEKVLGWEPENMEAARLKKVAEDLVRCNVMVEMKRKASKMVADEIKIGGLTWKCRIGEGEAWIAEEAIPKNTAGVVTIPKVLRGYPVTTICSNAFKHCDELTAIQMPESLVIIDEDAFFGCKKLTSVALPSGMTIIGPGAFRNCKALKSIRIPAHVTHIGMLAFRSCDALKEVAIPKHVASIGQGAFAMCEALESVSISIGVTNIEEGAFSWCENLANIRVDERNPSFFSRDGVLYDKSGQRLVCCPGGRKSLSIPAGVKHIDNSAFSGCRKLYSVTIPSSVVTIGSEAFECCKALTSVQIPDDVKCICSNAFYSCEALASVRIPSGLTAIEHGAFAHCKALKSVEIPTTVESIGVDAFWNCEALASVTIPANVTSIGEGAFALCRALEKIEVAGNNPSFSSRNGILYDKSGKTLLCCPGGRRSVTIPSCVTGIGEYAFAGCVLLRSVRIPMGVSQLSRGVFRNCSALTSVELPSSVASIGECAFDNCKALTSIALPDGLRVLEERAFDDCKALTSVDLPSGLRVLGRGAFTRCKSLTSITIPSGIRNIGAEAFEDCEALTSVTIPSSVVEIGEKAFAGCEALTSATIPSSVVEIGEDAFDWCKVLRNVAVDSGDARRIERLLKASKSYLKFDELKFVEK